MSLFQKLGLKLLGVKTVKELATAKLSHNDVFELAFSKLDQYNAKDLLLAKTGSSSFTQFVIDYISNDVDRKKVLDIEIGRFVRKYIAGAHISETVEAVATRTFLTMAFTLDQSEERNILKRKAQLRQGIRQHMPEITKDDTEYLVELLGQYVKI